MATISSKAKYDLKPTSVAVNRKTLNISASNNTTFSPGDVSVFYLPALQNNLLDPWSQYLRFTATITGTGHIDNTAHSFIERIMTYQSGNLLDDLQNYSVLANALVDASLSQSEKIGVSPMLGSEDTYFDPTQIDIGGDIISVAEWNSGLPNANRIGQGVANATSYTFCIPIIYFLGTLAEKYIPVFAMSDDFRVEITWSSALKALVSATGFTITNPEIVVDYLEVSPAVISLIQSTYKGRDLVIACQSYKTYTSSIPTSTSGSISQIIPCKVKSARMAMFSFRPANTQVVGSYAVSSRVNPFWSSGDQFLLNIGGSNVPQQPIRTRVAGEFSQYYASLQSAFHSLQHLDMNGSLSRSYFQTFSGTNGYNEDTNAYRNGFLTAINLDSYQNQGDLSNSGMDLSGLTSYWQGFIGNEARTAGGASQAITVDTFILHDKMMIVNAMGQVMTVE